MYIINNTKNNPIKTKNKSKTNQKRKSNILLKTKKENPKNQWKILIKNRNFGLELREIIDEMKQFPKKNIEQIIFYWKK